LNENLKKKIDEQSRYHVLKEAKTAASILKSQLEHRLFLPLHSAPQMNQIIDSKFVMIVTS
jgi:hypothetical protein